MSLILSTASLRASALGLRLVVGLVFAHVMGAAELGAYFLAISIAGLGALIARGGMDRLALTESAHAPRQMRTIVWHLWRFVAATSLIMSVMILGIAATALDTTSDLQILTMCAAVGAIPFLNTTMVLAHGLRGIGRPSVSVFVGEQLPPLFLLGYFLLLPIDVGATRAAVAYLLAHISCAAISTAIVRTVPRPSEPSPAASFRSTWRQSWPLFIFGLNGQLRQSFVMIFGWLIGTPAEVGALGVALRLEQAALLPVTATRFTTAPRFTSSGDTLPRTVRAHAVTSARWASVIQIPVIGITFAFAPQLMSILGEGFESGSSILRVLLAGSAINALAGSTTQVLLMSKHRSRLARTSTWGSITLVAVGLTAGATVGVFGIAVALGLSVAVLGLLEWAAVRSLLGARVDVFARTD